MKLIVSVIACAAMAAFAVSAQAQTGRQVQTFKSSKGPIKITPVYHASMVIEAGGKVIVVDPAKPAVLHRPATGRPDSDYGHSWRPHGCRLGQDREQGRDGNYRSSGSRKDDHHRQPVSPTAKKRPGAAGRLKRFPCTTLTPTRAPKPGPKFFTPRDEATATSSRTAARASIFPAIPRALPKCARSRISTSRSSA